jgi:hypothetical protein
MTAPRSRVQIACAAVRPSRSPFPGAPAESLANALIPAPTMDLTHHLA